ncbi:MAG: sigma-54 dependent transcriptional regulator [Polyangia bacterium]
MTFRTLIVDDEETYALSLKRLLSRRGVEAQVAGTAQAGIAAARAGGFDLVILDYMLPDGNGLDLIPALRALRPAPTVLMMTAYGTIENAVEAMRRGASDYLTKSPELPGIVERVVETERIARMKIAVEQRAVPANLGDAARTPELLGDSAAMREVRDRIVEVARAQDTTVLLTGESGTGKGVVARAIHALSPRHKEPFVAIDCVALPATLAESELFGYERGAFTGAEQRKPGRLEVSGKGTVLLDEVGDMELQLQGKILRVLEERTFERVGGVKPIDMSARVISASHRDLGRLVEEGKFRLDLYHRLSVFPITIAPLRARGEDIALLAEHFASEYATRAGKAAPMLGAETRAILIGYEWPGNVRELKNVIERAVILEQNGEIEPGHLPDRVSSPVHRGTPRIGVAGALEHGMTIEFRPGIDTLDDTEKRLLVEALKMAGGKKAKAAEILGISRFALLRRVEKFGL